MKGIPVLRKVATSALLIASIAACGLFGNGCAYGGVAAMSDGTVIVARNSLLGSLRKIFICKLEGNELKCVESPSAP